MNAVTFLIGSSMLASCDPAIDSSSTSEITVLRVAPDPADSVEIGSQPVNFFVAATSSSCETLSADWKLGEPTVAIDPSGEYDHAEDCLSVFGETLTSESIGEATVLTVTVTDRDGGEGGVSWSISPI